MRWTQNYDYIGTEADTPEPCDIRAGEQAVQCHLESRADRLAFLGHYDKRASAGGFQREKENAPPD